MARPATIHEPTADERREASEQRRRRDARVGAGTDDHDRWRANHRRQQRGRQTVLVATVMALGALGLTMALAVSALSFTRSVDDVSTEQNDAIGGRFRSDDGPTPVAGSGRPLGTPPPAPAGRDGFAFLATQADGPEPVAYDPCRPISFRVNDEDAPPGAGALLDEAIARVADATGLVFQDEGATDERPGEDRAPFQPERYGDRWAPVVIWWATPRSADGLRGDVAGFAGSTSVMVDAGTDSGAEVEVYVTGAVVLDGAELARTMEESDGGRDLARAIVVHELGHLVGLEHVEDPDQLMYPDADEGVTELGPGDLRGLHELGRGTCVPRL